jgi:hypothetical protein
MGEGAKGAGCIMANVVESIDKLGNTGSLAILAAIRRASSWVSNLTPARFDRAHSH